jgi:hypothetical protein
VNAGLSVRPVEPMRKSAGATTGARITRLTAAVLHGPIADRSHRHVLHAVRQAADELLTAAGHGLRAVVAARPEAPPRAGANPRR